MNAAHRLLLAGAVGGIGVLCGTASVRGAESPVAVKLIQGPEGWRLERDGKPYFIRGAGGSGSLPKLAATGANSVRTWGADNLQPILDEAQKNGLTVTVGIWLGHERHGFNYNNADQVAAQQEQARQIIQKYKDHPAVLMWGIGNEMEGYEKGDNAAIWSAINNLAVMAKRLDPQHPTMTVVSEIGGDRVKNIHRLCPDIDVVGINSYAGGPSIPKRYREAGGTKPYVLTEFGPAGMWESAKTKWGSPIELNSTDKAVEYRKAWDQGVVAAKGLALGGYAFTWGSKQEATATWFGMLLPDGSKTGAVDSLTEAWTGKLPSNRCPQITSMRLEGVPEVDPGTTVRVALAASDPESDPLKVQWVLAAEPEGYGTGGDAEAAPPTFPEALIKSGNDSAEVKLPSSGGGYRLYAYVRDGQGGAAVASMPMLVKGPVVVADGKAATLPLSVYTEMDATQAYLPTGWMGNLKQVTLKPDWAERPHAGKTCIRVDYAAPNDWAGVVWQSPASDWGDRPGGWDLTGAKKLTFCARGETGAEQVSFQFGLIKKEKRYFDTAAGKTDKVMLSKEWQQFTIDLAGKDLKRIKTGFCWVVAGEGKPTTFYLDDIRYE